MKLRVNLLSLEILCQLIRLLTEYILFYITKYTILELTLCIHTYTTKVLIIKVIDTSALCSILNLHRVDALFNFHDDENKRKPVSYV